MLGVDESIVSGVDCKMLYLFFVTIDGDSNDNSDDCSNCFSGIISVSDIIVISSAVRLLWFCDVWVLFEFCKSFVFVNSCNCG